MPSETTFSHCTFDIPSLLVSEEVCLGIKHLLWDEDLQIMAQHLEDKSSLQDIS